MSGSPLMRLRSSYLLHKRLMLVFQFVSALLITVIMIFPLYWMFISSVKSQEEILSVMPTFWPRSFHFENYLTVWNKVPFGRFMLNTVIVTFCTMIFQIGTGIFAAYGFAKGKFWGRNILFLIILGALMIPLQVTFIPLYILSARLEWINTYMGLVLPTVVSPYFIFMLRQAFMSVDESYIEAGKVDGMGIWGTVTQVLLPMCRSTVVTISLITFIDNWNAYFWPKIITNNDTHRVLTIGLTQLKATFGNEMVSNYNEVMAGVVMSILPILLLFIVFQKHMLSGYSKSAMK